ncbi:DNA excision repair protein ERCC-6-like [Galleria mellonella]|uniref:DNA repair and recombination protein RAD54-like n=1 Tax=Galleria mellonella TaxID=7137 RepID=A0A6J3BV31_GALME|nr:DNA excision repair protein ERCC-6-like [Galleria mellonella]
MVDINKYLETQLALAQQKRHIKNFKKESVSLRSKTAAEIISKKQNKHFSKCSKDELNIEHGECSQVETSTKKPFKDVESDEEEYLPSGDESNDEVSIPYISTTARIKQNLKKIIDDGDRNQYDARIKCWKVNQAAACLGNYKGDIISADIKYIVDGKSEFDKKHELQNGLYVPNYIWRQLYKYQKVGVKWLWELHQLQSGGLLGDEMGLGKTVQIIAFLAGLSNTDIGKWNGLGPSIIVAPATIIYQWVSHFHFWYPVLRIAVLHHSGSHVGNHNKLIRDVYQSHGILLVTYAGIVKYSNELLSRKWHYVILDEGHKIRNPNTQVSKLIKKLDTPHRIIITGSPMQNSLQELWSLFDFMSPGLLGTYNAFMEHFALPITQGGYANATQLQEATALEIAKALKNIITPYMLRRTKTEVQDHIKLPEKNEQVLFCALSQEQRDLYMGYLMSSTVRSVLDKDNKFGDPLRARILVALSTLRKICNHPDLYLYEAQENIEDVNEDKFGHWKRSGKMTVVNSLLKIWQKQGHRVLIFSQSRAMLCILEQYLQNQNYKYLKMDGSVSVSQRQNIIKNFNEISEYLVFLSTTRVGGLGVNLTGADRVIIYDPDWNPATDNQAKERAWRIGQQRNVTVYRLLSAGTIEEKIYQRQIFKHFLSNKILIDPNQKNVLTTSTLQGLFTLEEPNSEGDTETASLFKHTKISVTDKDKYKNTDSTSVLKLEEMRKKAREISRKISKETENSKTPQLEDPRERYKKKRELILNPPRIEEPEINLVDDKVTNASFDTVISEIEIIEMHTKKNYEENLIQKVLNSQEQVSAQEESTELQNDDIKSKNDKVLDIIEDITTKKHTHSKEENINTNLNAIEENCFSELKSNKRNNRKRKRRDSESKYEIDNLLAIKKIKNKKHKINKDKISNDDDYVLTKLFVKASVKNALQHDAVVGLAEKEKRHKMKEEALVKAKLAVRAIKFSS